MKDKITVAIACAFLIGMFLISRTASIASSNESFISETSMPTSAEDTTMDFIDYETPETTHFDVAELRTKIFAINTCTLETTDTDALTCNEAFGYYRQCLGSDSSFQWKDAEYTTIISKFKILKILRFNQ